MAHILRGDEVEIDGHYDLDAGGLEADPLGGTQVNGANQVRIVENCPQYTIVEVVCPCGQTSYIRCEH